MEDTALLMAASALEPGVLVDRPTLRHRRHPAQASARTSKFAGGGAQIALLHQRLAELDSRGLDQRWVDLDRLR